MEPSPNSRLKTAAFVSPWIFVPVLYFAQGLPGMMVQNMTSPMLNDLGVDNKDLAAFTALISWPWVLKMLWGPVVDNQGTKRTWIIGSQVAILACIIASAFAMLTPGYLWLTLISFFILAFLSATHDIAADGFYLLGVQQKDQSFFIGIRSACFRLATIFTTGFLVAQAGRFQAGGFSGQASWALAIGAGAVAYGLCLLWDTFKLPRPEADQPTGEFKPFDLPLRFVQVVLTLGAIILGWRLLYWTLGPIISPLFGYSFPDPVEKFGTPLFLEKTSRYEVLSLPTQLIISAAIITIGLLCLRSLFVKVGLKEPAREFFSQEKVLWVLGFVLFFRFGEVMIGTLTAPFLRDPLEKGGLNISLEQLGAIQGVVGVVALTLGGILGGVVISKFGIKKCLWPMVLSLNIPNLLYLYAANAKLSIPEGVNPIFSSISGLIAVDQFGYGFGFSAYMVYLLFLVQGKPRSTSLYAIATGLMILGANVARLAAGLAFDFVKGRVPDATQHYFWFFAIVCLCTIPGMLTLPFIPMKGEDIKEAQVDID